MSSLIVVAACAEAPAPPSASLAPDAGPAAAPESEPLRHHPDDAFCDHRRYGCWPLQANAQNVCSEACLFPSHCQDYTQGDYIYCGNHPDSFDRYYRYCDAWGNPAWTSFCAAGPRP